MENDLIRNQTPQELLPGRRKAVHKPENYLIRNQTPHELVLEDPEAVLKLAPLQRRRIGGDPSTLLHAAALGARRDHAVDWEKEPIRSSRLLAAAWLAAVGITAGALGLAAYLLVGDAFVLWLGVGIAVACSVAGAYVIGRGRPAGGGQPPSPQQLLDPNPPRGDAWGLVRDFLIATSQGLLIAVLVLVAVAAPASAIYYGTELSSVIAFHSWHRPSLVAGPNAQYIVVARLLQLILLIIVSLIPALMYFQFDREKLSTLVDRWLHAIFRLDPSLRTVSEVDAKYGRRVEEFYGTTLETVVPVRRKRLRDRSPVIVVTLLIALGWIVVLLNNARMVARTVTPLPSFEELFRPSPTPMTLAFLGAYFLSVQVALRGYLRGDLKPKTYNLIIVRILMAFILAWVMQALWGANDLVLGLSFLAGIVPNTVLLRIRDRVLGGPSTEDDELRVRSPLSKLDEVDVYERARLEEEGITSIQALARHDLVDLILSSRIPVPRLIDWIDQAVLHQHVPTAALTTLRELGVRTATDYLQVCDTDAALAELKASTKLIGFRPRLLQTVLEGDEWLSYIQNWRDHDGTEPAETITYDAQGHRHAAQPRTDADPATLIPAPPVLPAQPNGDHPETSGRVPSGDHG
jgi:hypothetical protein